MKCRLLGLDREIIVSAFVYRVPCPWAANDWMKAVRATAAMISLMKYVSNPKRKLSECSNNNAKELLLTK
jgi:hypothetical protein